MVAVLFHQNPWGQLTNRTSKQISLCWNLQNNTSLLIQKVSRQRHNIWLGCRQIRLVRLTWLSNSDLHITQCYLALRWSGQIIRYYKRMCEILCFVLEQHVCKDPLCFIYCNSCMSLITLWISVFFPWTLKYEQKETTHKVSSDSEGVVVILKYYWGKRSSSGAVRG